MQERSIHNVGPLPDGGIETLENSKSRPQRVWNKISEEIGSAGSPSPKNQNQNSNQSRFYQAVHASFTKKVCAVCPKQKDHNRQHMVVRALALVVALVAAT
jgi:uncharacterized paraquat-inducible protein A